MQSQWQCGQERWSGIHSVIGTLGYFQSQKRQLLDKMMKNDSKSWEITGNIITSEFRIILDFRITPSSGQATTYPKYEAPGGARIVCVMYAFLWSNNLIWINGFLAFGRFSIHIHKIHLQVYGGTCCNSYCVSVLPCSHRYNIHYCLSHNKTRPH